MLVLLFLSVFINYIDRSNLSIAAPFIKDELGISASQLGILLSAFFWTYSTCQILSGWLVDRFDVKWVFAAGFFLWSSATAVTGLVHSLALLTLVRVVLGDWRVGGLPGILEDSRRALSGGTARVGELRHRRGLGAGS